MQRCGDWAIVKELGKGGQGTVYLARCFPEKMTSQLHDAARKAVIGVKTENSGDFGTVLFEAFHAFSECRLGALKQLHAPDKAKNPATANERFRRELGILAKADHPALVKLLGSDSANNWFVMEYHRHGALSCHRDRFKGNLLGALLALRPVVEAVNQLHAGHVIHRDIKPDNIFVAEDGHLVLGDFGLAFDTGSDASRLTATYENAGSSQWMPTWALGMRVDDIPPSFDVFTLGKTLWAMVSGRSFLRLHYFRDRDFDLELQFPDDWTMKLANDLLAMCIAERKGGGLPDAGVMLREIDKTLRVLRGTVPGASDGRSLARLLFPGEWKNNWRHANGKTATELFSIDEEGRYVIGSRVLFETRVLTMPSVDRVIFEKRGLGDDRVLVEDLQIVSEDERRADDGHGNSVHYVKVRGPASG